MFYTNKDVGIDFAFAGLPCFAFGEWQGQRDLWPKGAEFFFYWCS
jgi:hypothetical protein